MTLNKRLLKRVMDEALNPYPNEHGNLCCDAIMRPQQFDAVLERLRKFGPVTVHEFHYDEGRVFGIAFIDDSERDATGAPILLSPRVVHTMEESA